jgi:acetyl-CoA carboxylase biotin carboxyl carrier protein
VKAKIDYKEIGRLIDLLEERNLSHIDIEIEGLKISIGRAPSGLTAAESAPPSSSLQEAAQNKGATAEPSREAPANNLYYVKSPMVGTFYRSPDPSSPPFTDLGETVKKNQTLCIIEAMKLMNEIEAEVDGVVKEIFVKNGNPVEYGQKLFAIKPK